ncbi:MAG TPA: serine hydrolase, partial [Chryseobacterium sp.]|nr:serine hydrolase [Chryseobacterium sp.]
IKNLLEHSSGLGDFTRKNDSITWLTKKVSEKEIFDEIIKQGVSFQPSEKVDYSNSGYFLLTKIVEKLYKKEYATIVAKEIVKPLNLNNFSSKTSKTKNIFPSYGYNGKWEKVTDFEFSNVIGVGDMVATTADLNTSLYHLFQYKILKKESVEQMKPDAARKETFGRGLMLLPFYEHISYGHGGTTYGTHSAVAYNEEDGLGFSLILNGERFPHNDFAIGILSIIYDKPCETPVFTTYNLTTEELDKYLGVYVSKQIPLKITITKEGNTLVAQGTGQRFRLKQPVSTNLSLTRQE